MQYTAIGLSFSMCLNTSIARENEIVKMESYPREKKVDVFIGGKPLTSFLYSDSIEKPVLYPIHAANGTTVTKISVKLTAR